mmetsp:Transcript_130115/g.328387  ORF Transcript_130115/g.328387 Transcript_130115/m.328387 type:complete len:232 (-) Transcript_130115:1-696(-)
MPPPGHFATSVCGGTSLCKQTKVEIWASIINFLKCNRPSASPGLVKGYRPTMRCPGATQLALSEKRKLAAGDPGMSSGGCRRDTDPLAASAAAAPPATAAAAVEADLPLLPCHRHLCCCLHLRCRLHLAPTTPASTDTAVQPLMLTSASRATDCRIAGIGPRNSCSTTSAKRPPSDLRRCQHCRAHGGSTGAANEGGTAIDDIPEWRLGREQRSGSLNPSPATRSCSDFFA